MATASSVWAGGSTCPYIQRQTDKGLPRYSASDRYVHSGEELVPLADGTYPPAHRGCIYSLSQDRRRLGGHVTRSGIRWLLGETAEGRVANALGTFAWLPQRSVDTNGNEIRFFYREDGGQRYLSEIRYNFARGVAFGAETPDTYVSVRFEYEGAPRRVD